MIVWRWRNPAGYIMLMWHQEEKEGLQSSICVFLPLSQSLIKVVSFKVFLPELFIAVIAPEHSFVWLSYQSRLCVWEMAVFLFE